MKRGINLMTEAARFRVAARVRARHWTWTILALSAALAPVACVRWFRWLEVAERRQALEASYEPVQRLHEMNRQLRVQAASTVTSERLPLLLAHRRPVSLLLDLAANATDASQGELFVERIELEQATIGAELAPQGNNRLVIEAATTLSYDIAEFVAALRHEPIKQVNVIGDSVVEVDGVDRKSYSIECVF